ncbi:MAG: inner-rane translocator [Ilumatobacteraceae bacterium]|nr:inner-rane translocator [Ilumatobacteraceae bacterium]
MQTFLNILINGLVIGAVYAIAASGLVVTYSTSGIFNFAHGALGMFCAFVYWEVRVDHGWPAPLALVFVLLFVAPLMGLVLYRVVIRGLQGTSEIVKLVIPISLMLAFIALAGWIWDQSKPHSLQPFFGLRKFTIFHVVVTYHNVTIIVVSLLLAVLLRVLLFKTRMGISMRAVVDDRSLFQLNGGHPDRAPMYSWMLGVSLSALAGILITPFNGGSLSTTLLTLLVINAFAAAMVGRLRSVPWTYFGAIVLGLVTRLTFSPPVGIFPKRFDWASNVRSAAPMILLFVVLLILPQDRLRGASVTRTRERFHMPSLQQALVGGALLITFVVMISRIMAPRDLLTLSDGIAASIIMLSLVLLSGYAGEISLATMAFGAIGGTVFYHHVSHHIGAKAGWLPYLIAIVATAVVGAVVALPALRLRGLYLGLATAAFSVGVEQIVFKELHAQRRIYPIVLTIIIVAGLGITYALFRSRGVRAAGIAFGGSTVLTVLAATSSWLSRQRWSAIFPNANLQVPRPRLFGIDFTPQTNFMILLIVVFAVLGVGLIVLRRSSYGRRLTAMKDSPAACATLGMNIVALKLSVFMISAAIAGLGGCLLAQQSGAVTADRFSLFESLSLFMLVVVAGVGYVSGGFVGGLMYGAVFFVGQNIFGKLQTDYHSFHGIFHWLGDAIVRIGPATIGIGLGRNPSGFVNDIFVGYRPIVQKMRSFLVAGCVVELGIWLLALRNTISNWTFALLTILIIVILPRVAALVNPDAFAGNPVVKTRKTRDPNETPLELIGLQQPFSPADVLMLNTTFGGASERPTVKGM